MQDLYELTDPSPALALALGKLCESDQDFLRIEAEAGPVKVLALPPNFAALVRIIVGQQLSTRSARTIYGHLEATVDFEPARFLAAPEQTLCAAGLSQAKIACCRAAAQAICHGDLNLEACQNQDQQEVQACLTRIKGIGPWTAELFMLFALQRFDIFPAGDLALQRAYARLKQLDSVPDARHLLQAVTPLAPWRGAAAHLLWHAYRHSPPWVP